MTKQTVSVASPNTRVLSKTKNLLKLVVDGVKIAGEVTRVKFVARTDKGGLVVCRTKGQKPFRIQAETNAKGKTTYYARMRGGFECSANTPNKAFARGTNEFWALG